MNRLIAAIIQKVGLLRAWSASGDHSSAFGRDQVPALSRRQLECLTWAEEGKSARDTGQILGISQRTVEKHVAQAYEELGVRTRIQAVVRARQLGLLS